MSGKDKVDIDVLMDKAFSCQAPPMPDFQAMKNVPVELDFDEVELAAAACLPQELLRRLNIAGKLKKKTAK